MDNVAITMLVMCFIIIMVLLVDQIREDRKSYRQYLTRHGKRSNDPK